MRFTRLIPLLLVAALLPAQQTPPLAGIAHVALRVKSLDSSRAFYQALGFLEAFDLRRDEVPYESFIKVNDRQFIELYPVSDKDPDPAFLHLCFEGEDLEAIHDDYISHGLKPIAVRKAGAGNLLFTMPGPLQPIGSAGKSVAQNIEYTEYQPGSLHSKDTGQHLGPDRVGDRILGVTLAVVDLDSARTFYLNDLSFRPLPGEPFAMHLPGNSGEEIDLIHSGPTWPDLGPHARFTFGTSNLARAARHLGHEHLKFTKTNDIITLQDPDGNQILIRQR